MPPIRLSILACLVLLLSACQSPAPRPATPLLEDPPLQQWLQIRAEALSGGAPVVVEVVDAPRLQAELTPDGRLRIWRGLLLRTRDEAEVTFVLAHELAHRSLGHFERRAAAGDTWDALEAEREADREALDALRQMGLRPDAATSLLSLVAGESALDPGADRAGLAMVEQRLEVLWEQVANADSHPMRMQDGWRALMDARFASWLATDPAARDPARTALLRDHVRRPG